MSAALRRPGVGLRSPFPAVLLAVFALALLTRLLVPLLSSGGLRGQYDYDPSVYYSAADAILGGHVPYRDFNLVHPPLLSLALTPFALIGRLTTTDHTGFIIANLAFTVLGALNAVLAALLAKALGFGLRGAAAAGIFYAVWFGSVNAEFTVRLEPLGNTFFLLGLLGLCRARRTALPSAALLAGVWLGLGVTVKIWWMVPLVVVLAEIVLRRRWREFRLVVVGAATAATIVCLPFFVLAGTRMWRLVISAQSGRARLHGALGHRFGGIATVLPDNWHSGGFATTAEVVVFVLLVIAARAAWRVDVARVFVVLIAVQIVVLLLSPSYYPFYDDWLAVGGAMVVGAAAGPVPVPTAPTPAATPRIRLAAPAVVSALLAVTTLVTAVGLARQKGTLISAFGPTTQLVRVAATYRCMTSDSPMMLIEADALTRSFTGSCHNAVDVAAPRLGIDGSRLIVDEGHPNPYFGGYLARYLTAGQVVMLSGPGIGLPAVGGQAVRCGGAVARAGDKVLYRIAACSHQLAATLPSP